MFSAESSNIHNLHGPHFYNPGYSPGYPVYMISYLYLPSTYILVCVSLHVLVCVKGVYGGTDLPFGGPAELSEPLQLLQGWQRLSPAEAEGWEGSGSFWKFLRIAAPLLVHSWFIPEAQGSKRAVGGEQGLQGHGHMLDPPDWPYYTLHILPSACSIYSFSVWACMCCETPLYLLQREGRLENLCHIHIWYFISSLLSLFFLSYTLFQTHFLIFKIHFFILFFPSLVFN